LRAEQRRSESRRKDPLRGMQATRAKDNEFCFHLNPYRINIKKQIFWATLFLLGFSAVSSKLITIISPQESELVTFHSKFESVPKEC